MARSRLNCGRLRRSHASFRTICAFGFSRIRASEDLHLEKVKRTIYGIGGQSFSRLDKSLRDDLSARVSESVVERTHWEENSAGEMAHTASTYELPSDSGTISQEISVDNLPGGVFARRNASLIRVSNRCYEGRKLSLTVGPGRFRQRRSSSLCWY